MAERNSRRQPVCRLAVVTGPDAGMEFVIPARGGGIGRAKWNAIQLTDPQVSRSHCAVEIHNGQQELVDVGSSTGTRVNGNLISRHPLEQGDVISIGDTRLAYMPPDVDGDWSMQRTGMRAPSGSEILGGRYEILGLIGIGGMGSVYRVRDRELDEIVALKALRDELSNSPTMRTHFRHEVKLARRVTHRNVARIFDIGEHHGQRFLTMEYIDGEPLSTMLARRGALPVQDALDIANDLCAGLAAAHSADVIHRDLKPDNILIAIDGRVVITDFGIALDPALSNANGGDMAIAGTPTYMAPELIQQGASSAAHTDMYSFGCVLYEMVTGQPPWTGETQVEIITARLFSPPPDPRDVDAKIPDSLATIIVRCLATKPEQRYGDAAVVASELRQVPIPETETVSSQPDIEILDHIASKTEKRVVVVPFYNQGSSEDDYLAEGLTSELMDTLAMTPGLKVFSHSQVSQARAEHGDPHAIGRALGAQVVLTGNVLKKPHQIHIYARMINVADGFQLWAEGFEFDASNLLLVNDRAVRSMVEALALTSHSSAHRQAMDPRAVEMYLRGRSEYRLFWSDSVKRAREHFESALSLAPDDPTLLAASAMARARLLFFHGGGKDAKRAAEMARKANKLAPNQAESHLALAMACFYVNDLAVAIREVDIAIALSPTLAEAHLLLGRILMECGPLKHAEKALEQATLLDPLLHVGLRDLARARLLNGHSLGVVKDSMRDVPSNPDALILKALELTRIALWATDRATAEEGLALLDDDGLRDTPATRICETMLALLDEPTTEWSLPAQLGSPKDGSVRRQLFFWQLDAEIAAFRGDRSALFDLLERAADAGFSDINWLTKCPLLLPYQQHPPFQAVCVRVRERADSVVASWRRL